MGPPIEGNPVRDNRVYGDVLRDVVDVAGKRIGGSIDMKRGVALIQIQSHGVHVDTAHESLPYFGILL